MTEFERLEREFQQYDRGEPRLGAIRDAIGEADRRQDVRWRFWFRYDYLEESIFCGDRYRALIIFPELLQLYDSETELSEDGDCTHSLLVCFKWIVEAAPEFPQISRAEIDGYFREFRKRLRQNGKSLSIYFMKRSLFYMHVDRSTASQCFYRFLEEPLDDISDGRALFYDHQVSYYLMIGDEEKAMQAAEPVFSGKYTSNSLPMSTYNEFIRYYMRRGRIDEAMDYAARIERRVDGDPYFHDLISTLLSLYSKTDPVRGAGLFSRNYPAYLTSKNPWLRTYFAAGAALLFDAAAEIPAALEALHLPPGEQFDTTRKALRETAETLCAQFDARNGTEDYTRELLHPFEI